jgi:hypothetical protein
MLILAAVFAAFVILGILYEASFMITIISGLLRRASAYPHADAVQHGTVRDRDDRHRDAGRHRQKNAIMMVDFALERRRVGGRRACHSRGGTAAFPPHHDGDPPRFSARCRLRWAQAPARSCVSRLASPWSAASACRGSDAVHARWSISISTGSIAA